MTEAQIVSAIMNYSTAFRGVNGNPIPQMQVADEVDTLRLRYIGELDDKGRLEKPYIAFGQDILSQALKNDQPTRVPYITLPEIYLTRKGLPAVSYIGGTDFKSPYRIMTGSQYMNAKHDQFIGNAPIAVYANGTWRFYNSRSDRITIQGAIFNTPRSVAPYGYDPGYDNEGGESTTQYPAPQGVIDQIIGKTSDTYSRMSNRIPMQPNTQSDTVTGK